MNRMNGNCLQHFWQRIGAVINLLTFMVGLLSIPLTCMATVPGNQGNSSTIIATDRFGNAEVFNEARKEYPTQNWRGAVRYFLNLISEDQISTSYGNDITDFTATDSYNYLDDAIANRLEQNEYWWMEDNNLSIAIYNPTMTTISGIKFEMFLHSCKSDSKEAPKILVMKFKRTLAKGELRVYTGEFPLIYSEWWDLRKSNDSCLLIKRAW